MKFSPYETYVSSKLKWLDEIPIDWDVIPIKFGLEIPITDGPHETPELFNDGIPFLSAEAVKKDKLDFNRKRGFISLEEHTRFSKKYKPKRGDVYMVKSGATTGNMARVETDEEFNIWSPLAAMRPKNGMLTTDFLFYFMKSKPFFHSVELNWSYGTQQNIGMGVIANLQMALPPVSIQKKITTFLECKTLQIDQLIEKKKSLIEKLEEKRIAVITQVMTKGIDKNAKLKTASVDWLGDVPKHWELRRLKECSELISKGTTPSTEGHEIVAQGPVRFIKAENISKGHITNSPENYITEETNSALKRSQLCENDVLFVIAGATLGKVACVQKSHLPCNTNQAVAFIRPSEITNSKYLLFWLQSSFIKEMTWLFAVTSAQPNLAMGVLGNFYFPLPPKDEQQKIIQHLDRILNKLDVMALKAISTIERLEEYRSSIITSAVTGKIDICKINVPKGIA